MAMKIQVPMVACHIAQGLIWFFLFSLPHAPLLAQTRTREKVLRYAVAHEYLFWNQVSQHYPLTKEQIMRYQDQLLPHRISNNIQIQWSPEIIRAFPALWTSDLVINPSIAWDQRMIEAFHEAKWFDWHYITHNNREVWLSNAFYNEQKHNIPSYISRDSFLHNDSIKLFSHWEQHPQATSFASFLKDRDLNGRLIPVESLPFANTDIRFIPADTLVKYADWINWFRVSFCRECVWTYSAIETLFPYLTSDIAANEFIYDSIFSGILDDEFLEAVAGRQFPPSHTRYYEIRRGYDDFGVTPSIMFNGDRHKSFDERMKFGDTFPDTLVKSNYILDGIWEPPLRFADVHDFYHKGLDSKFTSLFVSARTKAILEAAVLPPHRFYPINVRIDDPWYGKDTMVYYVLLLDDTPTDHIIGDSLYLFRKKTMYGERISSMDTTYADFYQHMSYRWFTDSVWRTGIYENTDIPVVHLNKFYDLFTLNRHTTYISPRLMTALLEAGITGVEFSNAVLRPVVLTKKKIAPTKKITVHARDTKHPILADQRTIRNYKAALASRDSLLAGRPVVDSIYATRPFPNYIKDERNLLQRDSILRRFEIAADVMIPAKFRESLISGVLPTLGYEFTGYTFYAIEELAPIDAVWHRQRPYMAKGIMIAWDGIGNYLALLLQPGSSYKLSPVVYKIEHETGEVIPTIDIRERIK